MWYARSLTSPGRTIGIRGQTSTKGDKGSCVFDCFCDDCFCVTEAVLGDLSQCYPQTTDVTNKGLSNILYGFLNPNTVRILVGGWFVASMAVRISEN